MNHFQSLKTLSYVNIRRILRIWIQTIIPPAITTALYFLIFGELIGKRIGEMPGYEGLTYLEFMVPGLIMLSVITNSYANVASAFFWLKISESHRRNTDITNAKLGDYVWVYYWWYY